MQSTMFEEREKYTDWGIRKHQKEVKLHSIFKDKLELKQKNIET